MATQIRKRGWTATPPRSLWLLARAALQIVACLAVEGGAVPGRRGEEPGGRRLVVGEPMRRARWDHHRVPMRHHVRLVAKGHRERALGDYQHLIDRVRMQRNGRTGGHLVLHQEEGRDARLGAGKHARRYPWPIGHWRELVVWIHAHRCLRPGWCQPMVRSLAIAERIVRAGAARIPAAI